MQISCNALNSVLPLSISKLIWLYNNELIFCKELNIVRLDGIADCWSMGGGMYLSGEILVCWGKNGTWYLLISEWLYNCCCCNVGGSGDDDGCSGRYVDGNDVIDVGGGVDFDIIGGGGMYLSGVTCDMVFVISLFDWLGMIEM